MSRKNDICGIYKIINNVNGKLYIGQSKRIYTRWTEHKKELRRGKHGNPYLQKAWDKYGEAAFSHELIEECSEDILDERECYYIKLFNTMNELNGYNLTSGGGRKKQYSASTRAKLKINGTGSNNPNSKKVISLEDGVIHESINLAAKTHNTHAAMIYRCCTLKRYTAGGYHWMYYDQYLLSSPQQIEELLSKRDNGKTRSVIYLNTMKVYSSIKEAHEDTGANANSINQCCIHGRPNAGYTDDGKPRIFMYYKEYLSKNEAG